MRRYTCLWASQVALVVKNLLTIAGDLRDMDSIPGLGRSPRGGHGSPLQYSCLENPHGQRSLESYSQQCCQELDTTVVTEHAYVYLLLLFLRSVVFDSLRPHGLQQARLSCPSPSHRVCSNSHPLSQWFHPTTSSSVLPFSSHLQSFPASESVPKSQFLASGGQSIGTSAPASVLPVNIHHWFPLGLTGLISLLSKGLARVFSRNTVQKHQFFSAQPSLWSNSHTHNWLLCSFDYTDFVSKDISTF